MIPLTTAMCLLAVASLSWFVDALDKDEFRVIHIVVFLCLAGSLIALGFGMTSYEPSPSVTINLVPLAEKPLTPNH